MFWLDTFKLNCTDILFWNDTFKMKYDFKTTFNTYHCTWTKCLCFVLVKKCITILFWFKTDFVVVQNSIVELHYSQSSNKYLLLAFISLLLSLIKVITWKPRDHFWSVWFLSGRKDYLNMFLWTFLPFASSYSSCFSTSFPVVCTAKKQILSQQEIHLIASQWRSSAFFLHGELIK